MLQHAIRKIATMLCIGGKIRVVIIVAETHLDVSQWIIFIANGPTRVFFLLSARSFDISSSIAAPTDREFGQLIRYSVANAAEEAFGAPICSMRHLRSIHPFHALEKKQLPRNKHFEKNAKEGYLDLPYDL